MHTDRILVRGCFDAACEKLLLAILAAFQIADCNCLPTYLSNQLPEKCFIFPLPGSISVGHIGEILPGLASGYIFIADLLDLCSSQCAPCAHGGPDLWNIIPA